MIYWHRFPEEINMAPNTKGVYMLSDAYQTPVYVGRSVNLYERLSEHPDLNNYCLQKKNIKYFAFEETYSSEPRERELTEEYDPECNRTQKE
ncbi:unnamed protein product [marine sediment metagenome]|uniref:GIY-YIG domain-containing protein n=1 Tax=marine sediment metagenome TaxID=412755 RepID=X1R9X0_9ZZZZ